MSDRVILISSDDAASTSSENMARNQRINDNSNDNQSSSGSAQPSTSATGETTPKRRRKRKPKHRYADDDSGNSGADKDFRYQIRDRLNSDSSAQRRSPRNTPEAREARSRSLSRGISDEQSQGEDMYANLSKKQQQIAETSLAEINRKMRSVAWRNLD